MKKLPEDFSYDKYGVKVRLANEEDSEFILELRNNLELNQFIHPTNNDIELQRQWMREYKVREAAGEEYYLVYSCGDKPFGVNRLTKINRNENTYTSGSWICVPTVEYEQIIQMTVASIEICNLLELGDDHYDVRKGNKKVLRYHRQVLKAEEIGSTEMDILFCVSAEKRQQALERLKKYLGF